MLQKLPARRGFRGFRIGTSRINPTVIVRTADQHLAPRLLVRRGQPRPGREDLDMPGSQFAQR